MEGKLIGNEVNGHSRFVSPDEELERLELPRPKPVKGVL
jgi:hypothetical protein